MTRDIIGFSGKIASGKSTLAKEYADYCYGENYHIVSHADGLREEINDLIKLIQVGNHDDIIEYLQKELEKNIARGLTMQKARLILRKMTDIIGMLWEPVLSGEITDSRQREPVIRMVLQEWGTDVRRASSPNYWVDKINEKIDEILEQGKHVIVDDVRFTNEADNLVNRGATLIRIEVDDETRRQRLGDRDGNTARISTPHPSETELDNYDKFTIIFDNNNNNPDRAKKLKKQIDNQLEQHNDSKMVTMEDMCNDNSSVTREIANIAVRTWGTPQEIARNVGFHDIKETEEFIKDPNSTFLTALVIIANYDKHVIEFNLTPKLPHPDGESMMKKYTTNPDIQGAIPDLIDIEDEQNAAIYQQIENQRILLKSLLDKRMKEYTVEEFADKLGIPVNELVNTEYQMKMMKLKDIYSYAAALGVHVELTLS